MKKLVLSILFPLVIFSLAGCLDKLSPEEEMFEQLEKVVTIEKEFEEQQDPLVKLEKEEKEIYEKIINLGLKEYDQIVKLSDEAIAIANKRNEHIDKEEKSIKDSEKEFQNVSGLINDLDDAGLKKQASKLEYTMKQRYKIHEELYGNYKQGLQFDKELYEMLKDKNLSFEKLEEQINKINKVYENVLENNKQFNEKTDEYNKQKMSFYKNAGLDVEDDDAK